MWGGIDFFVSLEVLLSSTIPEGFASASSPTGSSSNNNNSSISNSSNAKQKQGWKSVHLPGNPSIRQLAFSLERRVTPVFVYPNATLFLQVLCSSGNRVHLLTPWSKEDTMLLLKSSEWVSFLADVRRVSRLPGSSAYSFASLSIDPANYVRPVLVVEDASRWSSATSLQLIEVQHHREGIEAFHSMELLLALSRCILYAEWLLRYPASSLPSSVALSNTTLFSYCRFFFRGEDVAAELMWLVAFHGGRVVLSEGEATHIVLVPPPRPAELASLSSSSSASSSSSEDDDSSSTSSSDGGSGLSAVNSSDAEDSNSGGDEDVDEEKRNGNGPHIKATAEAEDSPIATTTSSVSGPLTLDRDCDPTAPVLSLPPPPRPAPSTSSAPVATTSPSSHTSVSAAAPVSPTNAVGNTPATSRAHTATVPTVTQQWVQRCIRALRILPLEDDNDDDIQKSAADASSVDAALHVDGETSAPTVGAQARDCVMVLPAYKTKLLLCCLLPPHDARPLIWTTFHSIARQHHYDLAFVSSGAAEPLRSPPKGKTTSTTSAITVMHALTRPSLTDVVEVRLLAPASPSKATAGASVRTRGVAVNRASLNALKVTAATAELSRVALHRCERRRDKEAVFAHQLLVASQFLYSYDFVLRRRTEEMRHEAGTQTCGALRASAGVMTDSCTGGDEAVAAVASPPALDSKEEATTGSVDAEEWRHHLKNVEGKMLTHNEHPHTGKEAVETKTKAPEADGAESRETKRKLDEEEEHRRGEEASHDALPLVSGGAPYVSLPHSSASPPGQRDFPLSLPPVGPSTASVIFPVAPSLLASSAEHNAPPPFSPLHLPAAPLMTATAMRAAPTAANSYTACFIPTGSLTPDQQDDFFVELRSYPIFSSLELGNNVVRLSDGARCEFPTHKAAEDFHRIDFIEFMSLHLPIYPLLEEPMPPPQHEIHYPLQQVPATPNTMQQTQSLWTTQEKSRQHVSKATPPPVQPSPSSSSFLFAADHFGSNGVDPTHQSSNPTNFYPNRASTRVSDATSAQPPRKHGRSEYADAARRSPERQRRLDASREDGIMEKERKSDDSRRRHRDDQSRHRRDREERHRGSSGSDSRHHRRSEHRDERPRYGNEGASSATSHRSDRSSRESRRRHSATDSRGH